MSDPVVEMVERVPPVDPGHSVATEVRITNVGDQVEGYSVRVCPGPAAGWITVEPPVLSLLPGEHKQVTVTVSPPRWPAAPAGSHDYGLLVVSQIDADRRALVEGDVDVGVIHAMAPALVPIGRRGRHRGRYRLDIENTGSAPTELTVTATDAAQALSFALSPARLTVPAGSRASSYLLLRPVHPRLVGREESIPFSVAYRTGDVPEQTGRVDSVFVRRPVLPRIVLPLAIAAVVVAVLGLVAARTLLPEHRPDALADVAPHTPILREVRPEEGGVRVSWDPVPLATGYTITRTRAADATDVEDAKEAKPDVNVLLWPDPGAGQQCFAVSATNAHGDSEPSPPRCTTVLESPVAASDGVTGAYVVYGTPYPLGNVDAYNQAQAAQSAIARSGFQVKFGDSRSSGIPSTEPAYLLYQDGFPDLEQARVYCARVPAALGGCQPFPPVP